MKVHQILLGNQSQRVGHGDKSRKVLKTCQQKLYKFRIAKAKDNGKGEYMNRRGEFKVANNESKIVNIWWLLSIQKVT